MMYFIPAWYRPGDWKEKEEVWYVPKHASEFDDTVKQVQLFTRNDLYPYTIILLQHSPNFRHFLHRQSMYRANYWSCFDSMQSITRRKPAVFSYQDLKWPENVEFICSPFTVNAYLEGQLYAKVEFGDYGNMIRVDFFQNGELSRRNTYDDRGFVSLTTIYEHEKAKYEQYLDEEGLWRFTRFFDDEHVEVNPKKPYFLGQKGQVPFQKMHYNKIEEMMDEVLENYLRKSTRDDMFCIAMDQRHISFLHPLIQRRKCILSFFQQRFEVERSLLVEEFLDEASYLVMDTKRSMHHIHKVMGKLYREEATITPFDFRMDHSTHQEFHVKNISVTVDRLEDEKVKELIRGLRVYLKGNDKVCFQLFTRRIGAEGQRYQRIIEEMATQEKDKELLERFSVDQCTDEITINRRLKEKCMLIDLQEMPDHFLEMSALCMGIPQLVRRETQYVHNEKNGHAVETMAELYEWMDYYLSDLSHANDAKIASYKIGNRFSTDRIIKQWKEVLESVERASV